MAAGPAISTLIRNATILTMNDALDIVQGSVSVREGRIASVGPEPSGTHDATIDAGGAYLLPGFIQTHILDTIPEKVLDDMRHRVPLHRLGTPEEIANVYCFLASDRR